MGEILKYLIEMTQNESSFEKAKGIYEKGMHSGSYAKLKLKEKINLEDAETIKSTAHEHDDGVFETVIGMNSANKAVYGKVKIPFTTTPREITDGGIDHILFHYNNEPTDGDFYNDNSSISSCSVGGNPEPQMDGCLVGHDGGLVLQGYGAIDYRYDPIHDNKFTSTLMGYSEEEAETMFVNCEKKNNKEHCPYGEYDHYYKYYGQLDYGHHWIDSAFHQRRTDYTTQEKLLHGNEDFSLYSDNSNNNKTALGIAIGTATIALNVFTRINRLMVESAIGACKEHSHDFSTYGSSKVVRDYIEAWDVAVATYAGSILLTNDNKINDDDDQYKYGTLYFGMVEDMAKEFGVVVDSSKSNSIPNNLGQSVVNTKIMDEFLIGREALFQGDCNIANDSYFRILHLMRIPWIQGVLRSAYELANPKSSNHGHDEHYERGRGSAYLAALLPDLNQCSSESAKLIYDQLKVTSETATQSVDYKVIHDEIYKNLECLRVDCKDIGGYINIKTGNYFKGTSLFCDGILDAASTVNAAKTEHRYTNEYVPESSTTNLSSLSSSPPHSSSMGVVHYLYGLFVVCSCTIAVIGVITSRRSSSSTSTSDILSSVSSHVDYWFSRSKFRSSTTRSSNSSSSSLVGSLVELGNSSLSSVNGQINNNDSFSSSSMSIELSLQESLTSLSSTSIMPSSLLTMGNYSPINVQGGNRNSDNLPAATEVDGSLL